MIMISQANIEFRKNKIGGSDIASVLGKNKFGGGASLAQRILGKGMKVEEYNPNFEFGNRWEEEVAQLYAENHPEYLVVSIDDAYRSGLLEKLQGWNGRIVELEDGSITVLDGEHDFLVLNADFLLVSRIGLGWGILEIKTSSEFAAGDWGKTGGDGFPSYYQDQPKWYAARLGGDFVKAAVLIGQRDYREYNLETYTKEENEEVLNTVLAWYDKHIKNQMPVAPSFSEVSEVAIIREALEADEALVKVINRHKALQDRIDALAKEQKALDATIRAAAAEYSSVTMLGEIIFTNSEKESQSLDIAALERFEPAVYSKYLIDKTTKRFAKAKGYKALEVTPILDNDITIREVI